MNELKILDDNQVLTEEQYEKLAKAAMFQSLVEEMKVANEINAVNYLKEKDTFLLQCSKNNSKHTMRQYGNSLRFLEKYLDSYNINILTLKPRDSDDFATHLKTKNISNATVRVIISSCSAFYSFLERRYIAIKNPFRGTKTRPPVRAQKKVLIPTDAELDLIISYISNMMIKTAIIFMKHTGIRVGALENMRVTNNKYFSFSKGKNISGPINDAVIASIKDARLDAEYPFEGLKTETVRNTFRRLCKNMHSTGLINASYSVHDIRHLFAVTFYKKTKDIYALKELLNHSSISITEVYLKGLDL